MAITLDVLTVLTVARKMSRIRCARRFVVFRAHNGAHAPLWKGVCTPACWLPDGYPTATRQVTVSGVVTACVHRKLGIQGIPPSSVPLTMVRFARHPRKRGKLKDLDHLLISLTVGSFTHSYVNQRPSARTMRNEVIRWGSSMRLPSPSKAPRHSATAGQPGN